ncbi:U3 snoRNP protein [Heterostelium album PN500]|uniref:U3 snoRNP protein n=1 Tax=Heterostelium pallidum (strain ATCC 26659 / Pp 5 / PN500) TaxID=670386 RepID=D3BTD9_HETP5|nr:U3 snoRNP protein [Heterostelium album PN500]EFA75356.1 U3 snoRNP protein [Heterostelium album PN500]|eukprot:XP_020427490.1 U3 snoRNP protein [Heterostelium album PN500]
MAPPPKGNKKTTTLTSSRVVNNSKQQTNKKEKSISELYGKSDIDEFIDKKSQINITKNKQGGQNSNITKKKEILPVDVSDEEVEDFDDDDDEDVDGLYEDDDEELLDGGDDDDLYEDDEDEDDLGLKKAKNKKDLASLDNRVAWGKERDDFYGNRVDEDEVGSEDEEEEEREALALQEQRKKLMKEEDYQFEDTFNNVISKKLSVDTKRSIDPEEKILDSMNKDLSSIDYGNNQDIELLQKNLSNFTKKEKLQYLMQESPILLQLLDDFKSKIEEIKYTLIPILEKVKTEQLPTSKGISFLETKYHLLLSYCLNITYFLMLKASGSSIKDHPVIDQLVKIRTILEKIKPLDNKLQYQVEKLLKAATLGVVQQSKDDPMRFKPNLSELAAGGDDDDDDAAMMREANLYMVPQTASERSEKEASADKKRQQRDLAKKKKAANSTIAKFMEDEYGDAPEELNDDYDMLEKEDDEDKEVKEYEENNFTRITQTKKDKKKEKQRKLSDGLSDLSDFNDLSGILGEEDDKEERENREYLKKKRMEAALQAASSSKRSRSADEDIPLQERKKNKLARNKPVEDDDEVIESDGEEEYDGIPRAAGDYFTHDDVAGDKRKITKQIEVNRGLTRYRSREQRTPHLKNRKKFDEATKKRNNSVSKATRQSGSFKGVSSGVPRSVKSTTYLH